MTEAEELLEVLEAELEVLLVQADHVGSVLELEVLETELDVLLVQTLQVGSTLVLLEAEAEVEVEVFTDGVETTQTWVEVTVGWQLAGSTQLFQSPQVAEEAEVVGTTGLLVELVETTGLLVVEVVHAVQLLAGSVVVVFLETEELEEVHADQVGSTVVLLEILETELEVLETELELEDVHADHVGSAEVVLEVLEAELEVVTEAELELLHGFQMLSTEPVAEAEAAPAKAAAAMTDFILIVGGWVLERVTMVRY